MKTRTLAIALLLFSGIATSTWGQEAAAVYKKKCAMCHESGADGIPERKALEQKTPEDIVKALTTGAMKQQGASLTAEQRKAVADFLSKGTAATKSDKKAPASSE